MKDAKMSPIDPKKRMAKPVFNEQLTLPPRYCRSCVLSLPPARWAIVSGHPEAVNVRLVYS